jgi:hypothetical protein
MDDLTIEEIKMYFSDKNDNVDYGKFLNNKTTIDDSYRVICEYQF